MGNKTSRDWSGILPELVGEIANRLVFEEDYVALRGVCTSWRAAADIFVSKVFVSKAPLLMLSGNNDSDDRELYSVSKRRVCRKVSLPEATGRVCLDARFGWLLTISKSDEVSLLNPISRAQIKLPNRFLAYTIAAALSANPSDHSDFVLMVIFNDMLEIWRPGYTRWKRVGPVFLLRSLCFVKDRFYAINSEGEVYVFDPDRFCDCDKREVNYFYDYDPDRLLCDCSKLRSYTVVARLPSHLIRRRVGLHLVGSPDGELILITHDGDKNCRTNRFEVIQIDVMKGDWKMMSGLGKDAVFIGFNHSFYVRDAMIKPNCIYFSDYLYRDIFDTREGGGDTGVYDIQNRSIQRFKSLGSVFHPVWVDGSIVISN